MKRFFCNTLMLITFALLSTSVQAQTAADEDAIKKLWNDVTTANATGQYDQMMDAYTENAGEITPDGKMTVGKQALRANWDEFMKMVDEKPKFTYSNFGLRFVGPTFAVGTWDGEADIKIGGQQVGGKIRGVAFLHKIGGRWFVEFDALVPVYEMHPPTAGN